MNTLVGLTSHEIAQLLTGIGQQPYRARQLSAWIYRRAARSFDEMTDLPAGLRQHLASSSRIGPLHVADVRVSADGSVKYVFRLEDGPVIESVYLPYQRRVSVCLSTQVGCPAHCTFCATGQMGYVRNLSAAEIVDQYLVMQGAYPNRRISHVVFMGMGEPLLNVDAVVRAVYLLNSEVQLSARNITISTVGVVPGIRRLAEAGVPVNLAISLHAPDDELRSVLVPMARKWSLKEILESGAEYRRRTGRDVTYEYVLIKGVNDSVAQALKLAQLLEGYHGAVNVIPYNPVPGIDRYETPSQARVAEFVRTLEQAGRPTTQRLRRGRDAEAACGQLAGRMSLSGPPRRSRRTPGRP